MSLGGALPSDLVERGGRAGLLRGRPAVLSFGDVQGEAHALAEAAGLVPLLARTLVRAEGADRIDYLHRMLTQDVAGLAVGRGAAACVLTPAGRILGRLLLWHDDDALRLDFDPGAAASALPGLERYVIADDVVFVDESSRWRRALLLGAGAPGAFARCGGAWPEPGRITRLALCGAEVAALGARFGARVAAELRWPAAAPAGLLAALAAVARPCGEEALEIARVEEGVPAYGAELDERVLPNEARLDDALSWSKGCYPGQEPVVMAKHRGHPATLLVRLGLEGARLPDPGEGLLEGARNVGRVTTAVRGRDGSLLALGYVRHALVAPGTRLSLAGGGAAAVR